MISVSALGKSSYLIWPLATVLDHMRYLLRIARLYTNLKGHSWPCCGACLHSSPKRKAGCYDVLSIPKSRYVDLHSLHGDDSNGKYHFLAATIFILPFYQLVESRTFIWSCRIVL